MFFFPFSLISIRALFIHETRFTEAYRGTSSLSFSTTKYSIHDEHNTKQTRSRAGATYYGFFTGGAVRLAMVRVECHKEYNY